MKRLSSVLLSFALLSSPSAFAHPSASHVVEEDTILQRISDLEALVRSLTTLIESLSTRINASVPNASVPGSSKITTKPVNTIPGSITREPAISVDDPNQAFGYINGYGYWLTNDPDSPISSADILSTNIEKGHDEFNVEFSGRDFDLTRNKGIGIATYRNDDGFHGFYRHSNGNTGTLVSDVQLQLNFKGRNRYSVSSFEVGARNPIVIEGVELGSIDGLAEWGFSTPLSTEGRFTDITHRNAFSNVFYSGGEIAGVFSDQVDGTDKNPVPARVGGTVVVYWSDRDGYVTKLESVENSLVGVFLAEPVPINE